MSPRDDSATRQVIDLERRAVRAALLAVVADAKASTAMRAVARARLEQGEGQGTAVNRARLDALSPEDRLRLLEIEEERRRIVSGTRSMVTVAPAPPRSRR